MLSEKHVPFDLVSLQHSDFKNYRTLIVPESGRIKATGPVKQISSLTNHVKLNWTEQSMGQKQIMLPKLDVFEIVLVEYEP